MITATAVVFVVLAVLGRPAARSARRSRRPPGRASLAIGFVALVPGDPGVLRRGAPDRRRPGRPGQHGRAGHHRASSPSSSCASTSRPIQLVGAGLVIVGRGHRPDRAAPARGAGAGACRWMPRPGLTPGETGGTRPTGLGCRQVLEDVDEALPPARVADQDTGRDDRGEPGQDPLVAESVMAVPRVVHLPVDRERQDRVAGHPADLAEGLRLARPQMLEHLERPTNRSYALSPTGQGGRDRILDDDPTLRPELRPGREVHDVGADDQRPRCGPSSRAVRRDLRSIRSVAATPATLM